jgi:hypothetical protein
MSFPREFSRSFSIEDQRAFAKLSGDSNPLHIDPVAARRLLFGQVAVHGIHILLWALDCISAGSPKFGTLAKLRVQFDAPLALGKRLDLSWDDSGGSLKARAHCVGETVLRLSASFGSEAPKSWQGRADLDPLECADPEIKQLATLRGGTRLALPPSWNLLFPSLSIGFSPFQVAVLLASTRIVGMMCPGLHSIFSGLSFQFDPQSGPIDSMTYTVQRFDQRVSLLDIDVQSGGAQGTLHAFRRPVPVSQPGFERLAGSVAPSEFRRQKALVVGGSRGLGEITAKLLALGGADVTLTYAAGEVEAGKIVAEGHALGLHLKARHFDVHTPHLAELGYGFTHVYYFPTPRIPVGKARNFDSERFALLLDFYVTCLARTAQWLSRRVEPGCKLWIPSTVFLNEEGSEFPEYVAAKACAEAMCSQLSKSMPEMKFLSTRLPRLASDQTQSLMGLELADSVAVMLPTLRGLSSR